MFISNASQLNEIYDVIVIGGGMVGSPLALALEQHGFSTLLIEKQCVSEANLPMDSLSFDRRATAMSLGSIDILQALKLWDDSAIDACSISQVHVSESGKMGTTKLDAEHLGVDRLGAVVSNNSFGRFLAGHLSKSSLQVLDGAIVRSLQVKESYAQVQVEKSGTCADVTSKLVLAVDGAASNTAKILGIQYERKAYGQHALIANVETELENLGVAFERFSNPGPIAMLPIAPEQSALVWTLPEDQIDDYREMPEVEFCQKLTSVFGERLGRVKRCGKRVDYPLVLSQAQEIYRSRVLLAGNAAHSLHPVAGQGFNLALRGVALVLEHLLRAKQEQKDIGSIQVLKRIAEQHKSEQFKIVNFSDQIIEIFSENSSIPAWLRSLGLVGLNGVDALKQEFAKHTMGRAQPLQILKHASF